MKDKFEEIIVTKEELQNSFTQLFEDVMNYEKLLSLGEEIPGENLSQKIMQLLPEHHKNLEFGSVNTKAMELIGAYLKHTLGLLKQENITFQIPIAGEANNPKQQEYEQIRINPDKLNTSISEIEQKVLYLCNYLPLSQKEKSKVLLKAIAGFLKSILRKDTNDMISHINHIHFLTSSKESYIVINEVGRIAREIYDNLQEFSNNISLDELEPTIMDEMPDAIKKLTTVINRTEEATNSTLDDIENLLSKNNEDQNSTSNLLKNFESIEQKLEKFSGLHPEFNEEIDSLKEEIRNDLHQKTKQRLEQLKTEESIYMQIIQNQSFQDLTGQTLKKIIAFIENLELNLLELLKKYSGSIKEEMGSAIIVDDAQKTVPEGGPKSQSDVDSLLASFGF